MVQARTLFLVASAAACAYLVGLVLPSAPLRLVTKAVPVLCLAAWVHGGSRGALARLVVAGLLLSAAGDLLLELGLFLPGLVAFLLAHIAYGAGFLSETRRAALARAIPFALYGVCFDLVLRPRLGPLAMPVLVYTAAICFMMWRAAARIGASRSTPSAPWLGLGGALLFAASDTLIALDRFQGRLPGARYPIIALYWLGQLGIAASVVRRGGPPD